MVDQPDSRHPLHGDTALRAEFDDRFRGTIDVIRQRLDQYAALVDLSELERLGKVVDLGCGRGEWLDVLTAHGVSGHGVEMDASAAAAARTRGLDVVEADGLNYLRAAADGSLGLVTMFHLAEHVSFDTLLAMLTEAHRALAPGGIVVIETPNPRNLTVGAATFYIDPSHTRPLPPELLQFVGEAAGFASVRVLALNVPAVQQFAVPAALSGDPAMEYLVGELNRWFAGPMDSAMIATKESVIR